VRERPEVKRNSAMVIAAIAPAEHMRHLVSGERKNHDREKPREYCNLATNKTSGDRQ
jgi:hypothetical protein